jgi:hypothetical protein
MNHTDVVRQVLKDAASTEHFFDLSDGERLVRMIEMAFEKGKSFGRVQPTRRRPRLVRGQRHRAGHSIP